MENKATTLQICVQQLTQSFSQLPTPKTVNDIVNSLPVGISAIKKEMGEPVLKAFVTELLIDFCEFFNVKNQMNEAQAMQTVDLIIKNYYYFSLQDFKFCFENGKMGKNIKIYDRIDGSIIFQMLETYSKQRSEAFSATFEKEHDFHKYQQEKERGQ
jgi:hypothetical protein